MSRQRSIPKYFRISRDIIAQIQSGDLGPGQQIPSENEIIDQYGVSNTTARKALHEIERLGWATRVKGKGTYVQENRVHRSATRILGFTRNMLEAGRNPSTKLLQVRVVHADQSLTINRRKYTLHGPYCEIQRVRYADGIPMMQEVRCISEQFCPQIQEKNLEGSLYEIYKNEYGIQLLEINQKLSSVVLEGEELRLFELEKHIPAFRVEGVTFCGKELILEMENSVYRGDMYYFQVKATP